MYAILSGTVANIHTPGKVKIISILITAGAGGAMDFHIHDGLNIVGEAAIHMHNAANTTIQVLFKGIPFDNGFTAMPNSNVDFFLVEYETIE